MQVELTLSEQKFLSDFLAHKEKSSKLSNFPLLYSSIISLSGLFLFVNAVMITLNNLTDHTVLWVLLPGTLGGIFTILVGVYLLHFLNKSKADQKLVNIIKKIIN